MFVQSGNIDAQVVWRAAITNPGRTRGICVTVKSRTAKPKNLHEYTGINDGIREIQSLIQDLTLVV